MATHHKIEVVKLESAHDGYKVLASWRRPASPERVKKVDLWIPELAPSPSLMKNYRKGNIHWDDLSLMYACELEAPAQQDLIKPLALLSLRKKLVILCDCPEGLTCPGHILAAELEECRNRKDFKIRMEN